jgi:hypothetical protein
VQVNEPGGASDIRDGIKDMFLQELSMETVELTLGDIRREFLPAASTDKWIKEILKDYLMVDLERNEGKVSISRRGKYLKYERTGNGTIERREIHTRGRHYIFKREDVLKGEEVDMTSYDIDSKEKNRVDQAKMDFNPAAKTGDDTPF